MISRIDIEDMTDAQDEARAIAEAAQIAMTYRNWRGEVARRTIRPVALWFGKTDWHPEPGWLLNAWDCDKGERRDFALADCQFADLARPSQAGDERVARLISSVEEALQKELNGEWFTAIINGDALTNKGETEFVRRKEMNRILDVMRFNVRAALAAMDTPKGGGDE